MSNPSAPSPVMVCSRNPGEALWFFGGLLTFLATAAQTGDGIVVVEQEFPGGMLTPLHVQPREATSFYVLDGRVTFAVGDVINTGTPGAFVHVPAGVPHAFRVDSPTARLLNMTTPEHEAFFRAAGVPAPVRTLPPPDDSRGAVDMGRVADAAARFGVEIIGPPPDFDGPDPSGPPAVARQPI